MFKALAPLLSFVIAIGIFVTYIRPTLADIQAAQAEAKTYSDTVANIQQYQIDFNDKSTLKQGFTPAQQERLMAFLPDSQDVILVYNDLEAIANSHHLVFNLGGGSDTKKTGAAAQPDSTQSQNTQTTDGVQQPADTAGAYDTSDVNITLTGAYNDFHAFLKTVEQSLALYDVKELAFTQAAGDVNTYNVTLRMYTFNPLK